jgi:hypothetical protein
MLTYLIEFVPGYGPTDHFGREIIESIGPSRHYAALELTRQALRKARDAHRRRHSNVVGYNPGRFDIVRSDGHRFTWE